MKLNSKGSDDERLNSVLEQILKLAKFDYKAQTPLSGKGDWIDAICAGLNTLAEELNAKTTIINSDKKRLDFITDILLEYAVLDFSRKLSFSENADEIDAISAGLNTLGEELEFSISSQNKYATELEKANSLLLESNEKIQAIFNNTPNAIIATDLNFKITEWNKGAEKIYKYTKEEVIGKPAEEIINSNHTNSLTKEKALEQMTDEGFWTGELLQSTSRKEEMIIFCSASFIKNEQGIPIGYLSVNRDISDMRKTERELHEIEKRYHLLVNEVVDYAIILLDPNGIITSWNKGAEIIKGYTEKEIIGKHFSIFYKEEDVINNLPFKALEDAKQKSKFTSEGWRVKKDGTLFWADVVFTKLVDENGNLTGFAKITRDLTEKKNTQEEILQMTEELKRSNTELEQFAYVASHDLQEPLRMITSYVQLLEKKYKDKLDQDANDFINFAVDGANRMQTLIYSLLEYSRINRVKPFININLDDVLHEVVNDLSVSIKEAKAKIAWNALPVIYGDTVLIGQLFFNLISNAIKFRSDVPPEIFISCKKQNNNYVFSVKDNGIGIKKEYAEKIFVIFQRLHSKDKYPGTGIGLAICKKIVERHNGTIWIESEVNKGSTFYFTIKTDLKSPIKNNELLELQNG